MLLVPAGFLLWNALAKSGFIQIGNLRLVRPSQTILILQIVVSAAHLVFSGFTLYLLIPMEALRDGHLSGPLAFLSVFMALKFVILFFPIPGGLGILEGTAVALLTPAIPDYPLLGALLAYRIIFYLAPFAIALVSLTVYELGVRSGLAAGIRKRMTRPHRPRAA
jgi:phosphatidylglycerol lysyltransferase